LRVYSYSRLRNCLTMVWVISDSDQFSDCISDGFSRASQCEDCGN